MFKTLINSKYFPIIALFIFIIPVFISLLRPGFFPMQDDLQAFRVYEMHECFKDFQLPCRWVPDAGYQYGYPQFNYYPPSVYYLGEIFHLIGFQFIDSVKILFVLGYILSAFAMYFLLKELTGKWPAFVGAVLYTYIPYKAVEVYVRGAMSEFWSLVIFPLVFLLLFKLIKTKKIIYIPLAALSIGLLLITHNLMTIIFVPLAIVWVLIHLYLGNNWKGIYVVVIAGLLGLGVAAFFSLPVLFERNYAHIESLVGGYFDYRQHFVNIDELFISNRWGYGSSVLGPNDDLSLSTGPIHFLFAIFCLILALVSFKKQKKISLTIIVLFLVEMGVLFMMHQKSSFIWSKIPPLEFLQFPWRFLADSIFLLSLISGLGLKLIENKKLSYFLGGSLIAAVIILHGSFFMPKAWLNITDQDKFSGKSWEKQLTISIFDYLPIYAKLPPVTKAPPQGEVLEGEAKFIQYNKYSDYQTGSVTVTKPSIIRLPLFDFPGMKVLVNGQKVEHNHDDCRNEEFCLGLITFKLDPGNYDIKAKLTNTPIRTIGNLLTLFSLIGIGVIFFKYGKAQKYSN